MVLRAKKREPLHPTKSKGKASVNKEEEKIGGSLKKSSRNLKRKGKGSISNSRPRR